MATRGDLTWPPVGTLPRPWTFCLDQFADLGSEDAVVDERCGGHSSLGKEVAQCCGTGLALHMDQVAVIREDITELDAAAGASWPLDACIELEEVLGRTEGEAGVVVGFNFSDVCWRKLNRRVDEPSREGIDLLDQGGADSEPATFYEDVQLVVDPLLSNEALIEVPTLVKGP